MGLLFRACGSIAVYSTQQCVEHPVWYVSTCPVGCSPSTACMVVCVSGANARVTCPIQQPLRGESALPPPHALVPTPAPGVQPVCVPGDSVVPGRRGGQREEPPVFPRVGVAAQQPDLRPFAAGRLASRGEGARHGGPTGLGGGAGATAGRYCSTGASSHCIQSLLCVQVIQMQMQMQNKT